MRSAPIPAGVVRSASRVALASRAPRLPKVTSAPLRAFDRSIYPLFLYCYKSLFPQALCIHIYTKHPGVSPSAASMLPPQRSRCCAFSRNSFVISRLHALILSCPSFSQPSPLFSVAYALLISLAALFGTRSLYFQWLADSFVKYRGVGYPSSLPRHACSFRSATWTRAAHPTIIAVSSRFQVHG